MKRVSPFVIDLTISGDRIGRRNSEFKPLHLVELRSAAKFFPEAYRLWLNEDHRHLRDLFYEGRVAEICQRTAFELCRKDAA